MNGEFIRAKEAQTGHAYWLYNKGKACETEALYLGGDSFKTLAPLAPKWNFIPVIGSMENKTPVQLGCDLKGAFSYQDGQWVSILEKPFSIKDLGRAWVAYSTAECLLGADSTEPEQPPAMPQLPIIEVKQ